MKSVFKNIFQKTDRSFKFNCMNFKPEINNSISYFYKLQAMNFVRNVKLRANMYRNMNIEEFDIKKIDLDADVKEHPIDFNKKDELAARDILLKYSQSREYVKLASKWQKTLIDRKRLKRNNKRNFLAHVRKLLLKIKINYFPFIFSFFKQGVREAEEYEKLVIHSQDNKIFLNPPETSKFAVVEFKGYQHKVTKDDVIMLEKISLNAGDSFIIDKVLLVGSPDFTAVGKPYVKNAMVVCTVEENCRTEKVIVFKKKRRKGYQRNKGHRQDVTMVRVDTIFYTPDSKVVENNRLLSS